MRMKIWNWVNKHRLVSSAIVGLALSPLTDGYSFLLAFPLIIRILVNGYLTVFGGLFDGLFDLIPKEYKEEDYQEMTIQQKHKEVSK